MRRTEHYIGLMSGTSLDGIDAVHAEVTTTEGRVRVLGHQHQPFSADLRATLLGFNLSGPDEIHRSQLAANQLARQQASLVQSLLQEAGISPAQVTAIGSHGQTVRHRPGEFDGCGYTVQLNAGALLAELTDIDVVCDFRSRDVAAGGQGAPLVPAFHASAFGHAGIERAVLNLGGIANLSLLGAPAIDGREAQTVRGFDTGPANALLDHWIHRHLGLSYDENGAWAAGGRVLPELLAAMMREPFLALPPPKSTGRDLFNVDWLNRQLQALSSAPEARDVQATLAELTAQSIAQALLRHAPGTTELLVCGGGALNADLMDRLSQALPGIKIGNTAEAGLPVMQVEAAAFAWLAWAFVHRQAGNRPEVTGAKGLRVLGCLHPRHSA